jgi:Cell Wall Hydrolase
LEHSSGGVFALVEQDTIAVKNSTQTTTDWRVLFCAAAIGSGLGLGLGAAYMANVVADADVVAEAAVMETYGQSAAGELSGAALQREVTALAMGPATPAPTTFERLTHLTPKPVKRVRKPSSDLECLATAVYYEARGETASGQAAVAEVVLNRARHKAFPKSVCGVVFQGSSRVTGCQFSFTCDGSMNRRKDAAAWKRARDVAATALSGVRVSGVGSATHFHTTGVSPKWAPKMTKITQVGTHIFYRFKPRNTEMADATPVIEDAVMTGGMLLPRDSHVVIVDTVAEAPAPAAETAPAADAPQATDVAAASDVAVS